jgi:hypothetical protein
MKARSGLRLSCATAALLVGGVGLAPSAFAQSAANWAIDTTANSAANAYIFDSLAAAGWGDGWNDTFVRPPAPGVLPTKAPPPPPPPTWWFHGFLEAGGRGYTNNPQFGGAMWQGGGRSSLAKLNEYLDNSPGAFGNFFVGTGTRDGLYEAYVWGRNPGYDDQRFVGDFSKAGEHYLTFGWDETPHTYSNGATTLYQGVGSTHLTLPPGVANQIFTDAGCVFTVAGPTGCVSPITPAAAAKVKQDILNFSNQIGLGIRRDTASVDYRWTPNDSWDVRVNFTNTRRTGTQIDGVVFGASTSGVVVQAPKPVFDTTQNYGASGEYLGTSPWNQRYTVKVAYAGSNYRDDSDSYLVDNPFCSNLNTMGDQCARSGALSSNTAMMSLWPSNQMNGGTITVGADLPWKSRYMGTASYSVSTQNDTFLPFTNIAAFGNNGGANVPLGWKGPPGIAANSLAALPATSLNGQINTTLLNNVFTTQLTPDLKAKVNYRFYDYDNQTPELHFLDWVQSDATAASVQSLHAPVNSLSAAYTKQNAGIDFNWRPMREWNLGTGFGYQRYDYTRMSATATNEGTANFFADYKPYNWLTARGTLNYGMRRAENYNYLQNFGLFQWPGLPSGTPAALFANTDRQLYLDNRDRTVAKISVDIALSPTVTVTPFAQYKDDWYGFDTRFQQGLNSNHSLSGGVELAYIINQRTNVLLSYVAENQAQRLTLDTADPTNGPLLPANLWQTTVNDQINTFMFTVNHNVIPEKFDVRVNYTAMVATDHQPWGTPSQTLSAAGTNFPDVKTFWQRVDVTGIYTVDQEMVRRFGWTGNVKLKLRYAWERNSVANWQNDMMAPYMYQNPAITGVGYQTWMAYDNPNYNAQMISGSVVVGW